MVIIQQFQTVITCIQILIVLEPIVAMDSITVITYHKSHTIIIISHQELLLCREEDSIVKKNKEEVVLV